MVVIAFSVEVANEVVIRELADGAAAVVEAWATTRISESVNALCAQTSE